MIDEFDNESKDTSYEIYNTFKFLQRYLSSVPFENENYKYFKFIKISLDALIRLLLS